MPWDIAMKRNPVHIAKLWLNVILQSTMFPSYRNAFAIESGGWTTYQKKWKNINRKPKKYSLNFLHQMLKTP